MSDIVVVEPRALDVIILRLEEVLDAIKADKCDFVDIEKNQTIINGHDLFMRVKTSSFYFVLSLRFKWFFGKTIYLNRYVYQNLQRDRWPVEFSDVNPLVYWPDDRMGERFIIKDKERLKRITDHIGEIDTAWDDILDARETSYEKHMTEQRLKDYNNCFNLK